MRDLKLISRSVNMKNSPFTLSFLSLATLLIAIGCAGPAQTSNLPQGVSDKKAPEKASKVVVKTDQSAKKAFESASKVLMMNGYAIDESSESLLNITTEKIASDPNGILAGTPKHRVTVLVMENPTKVVLSGSEFGGGIQSPIQKFGQSGSPRRKAWAQLVTISSQIARQVGGDLSYRR